jgi:hypothetical protein
VLTPVVLKPSCKEVIPLAPEFILPQDGAVKQDCELNAGKRWLHRYQKEFGRHKVTLLGDDLYSHEPFCRDALAHGFDFIYVCKKSSHTTLYEWLDYLQGGDGIRTVTRTRWTGKRHETDTYRYAQSVPLRDGKAALHVQWKVCGFRFANGLSLNHAHQDLKVNFIDYWETRPDGKTYHYACVTDIALTANNVADVVRAGRSRWKVENETFNTLKNQGYNLEHNYGHGKKHLSSVFASLMMLAFLLDQVQESCCRYFQAARDRCHSRTELWEKIRGLFNHCLIDDWESFYTAMIWGRKASRLEVGYDNSG